MNKIFNESSASKNHSCRATAIYDLGAEFEQAKIEFQRVASAKSITFDCQFPDLFPVAFWDIHCLRDDVLNGLFSYSLNQVSEYDHIVLTFDCVDDYTIAIKFLISNLAPQTESEAPKQNSRPLLSTDSLNSKEIINARKCVEEHQGTLFISQNEMQQGLTITCTLPLYKLAVT